MSSIPAAVERLTNLAEGRSAATDIRGLRSDLDAILAELSRLEEENAKLRGDMTALAEYLEGSAIDDHARAAAQGCTSTASTAAFTGYTYAAIGSKRTAEKIRSILITKGGADV